jgi:hypothetical protein
MREREVVDETFKVAAGKGAQLLRFAPSPSGGFDETSVDL